VNSALHDLVTSSFYLYVCELLVESVDCDLLPAVSFLHWCVTILVSLLKLSVPNALKEVSLLLASK